MSEPGFTHVCPACRIIVVHECAYPGKDRRLYTQGFAPSMDKDKVLANLVSWAKAEQRIAHNVRTRPESNELLLREFAARDGSAQVVLDLLQSAE